MKCSMGTNLAKLTVLPSRTVFLTGQPMANISDHQTMVNLAPFGLCRSLGFPATASATAAALGTLTPMPCMHNTPFPWMGGKMDYLVKGQPALLRSSTCQCLWGGTISIVDDGQTAPAQTDTTKVKKEIFEKNQSKKAPRDNMSSSHSSGNSYMSGDTEDYVKRRKKHCERILKKMEELNTDKAFLFWTNGGAEYASDLRREIIKCKDEMGIVVNKLEDTEMGHAMESIVNDVMSALSGKDVNSMSWEEKKEVFDSLEEQKRKEIEDFQDSVSQEYAGIAAKSKEKDNAAIFLVVGTKITKIKDFDKSEGRIRVDPKRTWRKTEKPELAKHGYGIDGLLLSGI